MTDVSRRKRVAKGAPPDAQGRKAGQFAPDKKDMGPDPLDAWYSIDAEDRADWERFNFSSDEAREWSHYEFSPTESMDWRYQGFRDPSIAAQWRDNGLATDEAENWKSCGFSIYNEDKPAIWKDTINDDPEVAQAWRANGFNHAQALSWVEADVDIETAKATSTQTGNKFHHIPEMYQWHDQRDLDNPANDAVAVTLDPISRYHLYHKWFQHGFSPSAAYYWALADYSPDKAAELRNKYTEEN